MERTVAYKMTLTEPEVEAIAWHGYRYAVSEFLMKHLNCDNNSLELSEPEAWELRTAWEDEGPLSCGSEELNWKLQEFVDSFV
jgi:hypothetical protein